MFKKFIIVFLVLLFISVPACNMFFVALRNVPVFFTPPAVVKNKIKNPVRSDVKLSALWIGHATVLIQMYDKVIITDPVLTETMGELGRRVVETGIDVENIPPWDLILISHSHMDHLSLGSLQILENRSKHGSLVFAEDVEEFLPDFDFELVRMKNDDGYNSGYIGESKIINDIRVTTVFAQHWGGRYGIDGYLWGSYGFTGYMLEYKDLTVYFAGDTGYDSTAFKKLGSAFNIDLALIPIGPCAECENAGTKHHVFPPESVMVFKDLNAENMIPIHYSTFQFAQAPPDFPLPVFKKVVNENGLTDKVAILDIGAQKVFNYK